MKSEKSQTTQKDGKIYEKSEHLVDPGGGKSLIQSPELLVTDGRLVGFDLRSRWNPS